MKTRLRSVIGAFRTLRGALRPAPGGLWFWAELGERKALEVSRAVEATAHHAETTALDAEAELKAILADSEVTPDELPRLAKVKAQLGKVANDCHEIGEVVRL